MRIVIIGAPSDRERIRTALAGSAFTVIGEAASLSEARRRGVQPDAFLVAAADAAVAQTDRLAEPLTPREVDVLEHLAEGLPNKEIASRLGISDQTVKFHVAAISGKLGATNRTDAVRRAIRRGLVTV